MTPPLSRRTFLRGAGAALALPWMESLASAGEAAPPLRLAYVYVPNGVDIDAWTPSATGRGYELTPLLGELAAHRDELCVLSGLTADKARANGDGPGDHARAAAAFLTGVQPLKSGVRVGISADQLAAQHVGGATRLRSLALGCESGRQAGQCDSGYSCAYSSNVSWQGPSTPALKEVDPRAVFDRLVGRDLVPRDEARLRTRRSVLDHVREQARDLERRLGGSDRGRLDEYLTGVRELELRIERAVSGELEGFDEDARPDRPGDYAEHVRIMFDLLVLAFRSDSTRIATLMLANEGSNRSYPDLGVSEGHHSLSHHGGDTEKLAQVRRINAFHLARFAEFLTALRAVEEAGGTLLDNALIVYGSGISDGNRHNHDELPILLAGRGGGTLEPGRHVRVERHTPLNDLHLALLERLGVEVRGLGDGREPLAL